MLPSMFLNPLELKQLTGKVRGSDQAVELNKLRIPHIKRGDGEVLVARSFITSRLDPAVTQFTERSKPNFDHL